MGAVTVLIGDAGFGMGAPATMAAYGAAMRNVYANWGAMTPAQRLAALQAAVTAALPPGMPSLTLNPTALPANTAGQMNFQTWNLDVNQNYLNGPMTAARFADLTNTIYHEGRHGEQWYNMAQSQAAQGVTAPNIASNMGIPQSVAQAAAAQPAQNGTAQRAMGDSTYESVYGSRGAYRNNVLGNTGTTQGYQQYRALPEEEDAWRQGDAAERAYRNP
jgi:hypothetical protein